MKKALRNWKLAKLDANINRLGESIKTELTVAEQDALKHTRRLPGYDVPQNPNAISPIKFVKLENDSEIVFRDDITEQNSRKLDALDILKAAEIIDRTKIR